MHTCRKPFYPVHVAKKCDEVLPQGGYYHNHWFDFLNTNKLGIKKWKTDVSHGLMPGKGARSTHERWHKVDERTMRPDHKPLIPKYIVARKKTCAKLVAIISVHSMTIYIYYTYVAMCTVMFF